jgi:hypothetical protein
MTGVKLSSSDMESSAGSKIFKEDIIVRIPKATKYKTVESDF